MRNSFLLYFLNSYVVFINIGRSAAEELALLTRCNHSITSVGSFGFWSAYLGQGDVFYADVETKKEYRFSKKRFQEAKIQNFYPVKPRD